MDLKEMPERGFSRHPWEVARFRFFRRLLRDAELDREPLFVLDVGAGDGWFSTELVQSLPPGSRIVCWDPGYQMAASLFPETEGVSFTKEQPKETFDLILMLDVAEHVDDDLEFLQRVFRNNARTKAHVLFSVPAWPALMSSHDVALGHHRRYRPTQAESLLQRAGLDIIEAGGLFHSLLIARAGQVVLERLRGPRDSKAPAALEWQGGDTLRHCVQAVLGIDNALSRFLTKHGQRIPGLSFWALCRTS